MCISGPPTADKDKLNTSFRNTISLTFLKSALVNNYFDIEFQTYKIFNYKNSKLE